MITEFSRRGWIVPATGLAFGLAGLEATRALASPGDERGPVWPFALAFVLGGVALIFLGRRWRRRHGILVWDARRERLTRLPAGHTFCWFDVHVWGWIFFAVAVRSLFPG